MNIPTMRRIGMVLGTFFEVLDYNKTVTPYPVQRETFIDQHKQWIPK